MTLSGVPGGVGWMSFAVFLGLSLTLAFGWVARHEYHTSGVGFAVVMCSIGVLMGQLFMWTGVVTLALSRESLELERRPNGGGMGRYRSRSPIVLTTRSFDFDFARVHAVSIEQFTERHPGSRGRGGGTSSSDVCRARLLVKGPRRAVTLDETSNHRDERIVRLAEHVAAFMVVQIQHSDARVDR